MENIEDKVAKGRNAKGSMMSNAKLTEKDVLQIKGRHHPITKYNGTEGLAEEFGVSRTIIKRIMAGKCWNQRRLSCAINCTLLWLIADLDGTLNHRPHDQGGECGSGN